ncbi:MAG: Cyclic di-GMP binding protein [Candidatus Scalindua rubra]|uniref:Cyclic di-GMP binding protein n=1 Tax=Candidatus Scalindua rubra TaxID=1872076 RepID=A0A1E3XA98_9BACT|nr:MAG: Cyclic di-GMP binding protein [Candidatus Scalindua rubra]
MNIGTTFRVQFKGALRRLSCELIGIGSNDKYLIIKMPPTHSMKNISNFLNKGNDISVKYVHNGTVFGFQSRIIDLIYKPFKLVFIEYPEKIESYDFRGHKRIECFLPANVRIANQTIKGSITDISRVGCLFVVKTPKLESIINLQELNNEINVGFQLPGIEKELIAAAKLKSIKKDNTNTNIGIEFINMDSEVQAKLFDFLLIAET